MALDPIDLRNLVDVRLKDAKVLLDHGQYDGAYYLSGYAVECALKSVIAGFTREHEFPEFAVVRRAYTHDLQDLLVLAKLDKEFANEFAKDPQLKRNWNTVTEWEETSRYEGGRLPHEAEALYLAISDATHGVLGCISRHW